MSDKKEVLQETREKNIMYRRSTTQMTSDDHQKQQIRENTEVTSLNC